MLPRLGRLWMLSGSAFSHVMDIVLTLAILTLLALTIIMLERNIRLCGKAQSAAGKPVDILAGHDIDPLKVLGERFAKGEISEEEYERKKGMLQDI
jgi:uncharacterized membrane protein